MPKLRSFVSKSEFSIEDPPGVVGKIRGVDETPLFAWSRTTRLFVEFPVATPVSIAVTGRRLQATVGAATFLLTRRFSAWKPFPDKVGFLFPGLEIESPDTVRLRGRTAKILIGQNRIRLQAGDELIWTLRSPWKESDPAAMLIYVVNPEELGDDLPWWLLLALVVLLTKREDNAIGFSGASH